jgi:hypothetical protein
MDRAGDARWLLAQRIAASGSLGRSKLLADFLLYIVDRHIHEHDDEITERQIGVLVFGRNDDYDVSDDNIVRSYARNLRKRVDEYFATEGRGELLQLEIPRGGYTPIFSTRMRRPETSPNPSALVAADEDQAGDLTMLADPAPHEDPASVRDADASRSFPLRTMRTLRGHRVLFALCVGIGLGVAGALLLSLKLPKRVSVSSAGIAADGLWRQIFSGDRDTFIVPSDDGLVIMQGLTARPVPLESYINGSYRTNVNTASMPGASEILKLGGRRYTSVVDLDFVAHLAQLDEVVPERMLIRYARDLRMDDLRTGNAILIGSVEANPWIELFQSQLNFRFSINPANDKPSGIINMHPLAGENVLYGTPGRDHTYGLIAYVPNLDATGHVLIVGGLNTAGTQAATTFLLHPSLMLPTLQRARAADGGLKTFELLIGADNVAANASTPRLILERIGPP